MIIDEFHDLAAELSQDFMVEAELARVTTAYDPRLDKSITTETRIPCRAVMAPRKIITSTGTVYSQVMATLTVKPKSGDKLFFGTVHYTIEHVEEVAPDGRPIIWMAGVK